MGYVHDLVQEYLVGTLRECYPSFAVEFNNLAVRDHAFGVVVINCSCVGEPFHLLERHFDTVWLCLEVVVDHVFEKGGVPEIKFDSSFLDKRVIWGCNIGGGY